MQYFSTKDLQNRDTHGIITKLSDSEVNIRVWRSLVSRLNGVQEALSSNLNTRTKEYYRKVVLFLFLYTVGRTQGLLGGLPPLNPGPKGNSASALVSLEFESQHSDHEEVFPEKEALLFLFLVSRTQGLLH